MTSIVRVTNTDKSQSVLTWKRKNNGLYDLTLTKYDKDGYYLAAEGNTLPDVTMQYIEEQIDAIKDVCTGVHIY